MNPNLKGLVGVKDRSTLGYVHTRFKFLLGTLLLPLCLDPWWLHSISNKLEILSNDVQWLHLTRKPVAEPKVQPQSSLRKLERKQTDLASPF